MGVPHFFSTFLVCLYQRYLSSKIKQLLAVLLGIEEHPANKKKIKPMFHPNAMVTDPKDVKEIFIFSISKKNVAEIDYSKDNK